MQRPDIIKIAAAAARDPRTVETVLRGGGNAFSRQAVIEAAARIGIPLPDSVAAKSEAARFVAR